uniref:Uncharacterized protein n=1 Tax=Oryza brachyantha TaxID=4533 RepID=J3L2V5_ORYBR
MLVFIFFFLFSSVFKLGAIETFCNIILSVTSIFFLSQSILSFDPGFHVSSCISMLQPFFNRFILRNPTKSFYSHPHYLVFLKAK